MTIDFKRLAQGLNEQGLMDKSPRDMGKEEIEQLCKTVLFCAGPLDPEEDIPFAH